MDLRQQRLLPETSQRSSLRVPGGVDRKARQRQQCPSLICYHRPPTSVIPRLLLLLLLYCLFFYLVCECVDAEYSCRKRTRLWYVRTAADFLNNREF